MTAREFTFIILLMVIPIINISEIFAWDDKVTHADISKYAAENSVLTPSKGDYLKNLGYGTALTEKFSWNNKTQSALLWLREGATLEDAGNNINALLGAGRFNNHFHNPLKPWGSAGLNDLGYTGESTIFWAQYGAWQASYVEGDWSWSRIRNSFYLALTSKNEAERQANFAQTFKGLGHQMHLIQDMAVPAHVRNDAHPEESLLEFNRLSGDYYFETWVKKYAWKINPFAAVPVFPAVDLHTSRNGLAPISQFIDAEQYHENVVPSKNLNWGLSEYTSANFVSTDTIFTEKLGTNNRHYFPYPRYTDQSQCYEQYEETYGFENKKRTYLRKKCPGESVDHFVTVGPFFKYLPSWGLQRLDLRHDEASHNDYAAKLAPRAVGYSAALLNYFFRGDIDMFADATTGIGYVIMNNADEDMTGTFELWYDNTSDQRVRAWGGAYSIGKKSSGKDKSTNITFTAPSDAKEPNKYLFVFRGKLGAEDNAVVAKTIKLTEAAYVFLVRYDDQAYSLTSSAFEILVKDNQYRLVTMPQTFSIPIQKTDPASHNFLVQSADNSTNYSFSYPGRFWLNAYRGYVTCPYSDRIGQYGVAQPSGYYQNEYQCHYGTNDISMPLDYWWQSALDGKYSLQTFGRHNYTKDGSGTLAKINESIWKDVTGGCAMNYLYRYKTDIDGAFVTGGIVATDKFGTGTSRYVAGQGWIECEGPAIGNSIVAVLGNERAIFVKTERSGNYQIPGQTKTERFGFDYDWETYRLDYGWQWFYNLSHVKGTLVVPVRRTEAVSHIVKSSLEVGGSVIDTLEGRRISHGEYIGNVTNENVVSTLVTSREVDGPEPEKLIIVTPGTISIMLHSSNSGEEGVFTVHDYDNMNGDQSFAVIYSKQMASFSEEIGTQVIYELAGRPRSELAVRLTNENRAVLSSTSSSTNETAYMLALKTFKGTIQTIPLVTLESAAQKATFFSVQMNETTVVYTYVVQTRQNSEWVFEKRLMGLVNVSDPALPIGYTQEFEINPGAFPLPTFDYAQGAAIGIHKGK
jgi:hypothetical protein